MDKGDTVRVLRLDDRNLPRVKVGQLGEVKATRFIIGEDEERHVLVKLVGRTRVVSFNQSQLEVVK